MKKREVFKDGDEAHPLIYDGRIVVKGDLSPPTFTLVQRETAE